MGGKKTTCIFIVSLIFIGIIFPAEIDNGVVVESQNSVEKELNPVENYKENKSNRRLEPYDSTDKTQKETGIFESVSDYSTYEKITYGKNNLPRKSNRRFEKDNFEIKNDINIDNDKLGFSIEVENITAGEKPLITFTNSTNEYGEDLEGEKRVEIKINKNSITTSIDFIEGEAEYEWNEITKAGSYLCEVTIKNITEFNRFIVEPSEVKNVEIYPYTNKTIISGEEIVFSAEARDEYGNIISDNVSDFEWENTSNGIFYKESEGLHNVTASYRNVSSSITTVRVKISYFRVMITEYEELVVRGENSSVEFTIKNWGEDKDLQNIVFTIDGNVVDIHENLTLRPGEEYNGVFNYTIDEEGYYELKISSQDMNLTTTIKVSQQEKIGKIIGAFLLVPVVFSFIPLAVSIIGISRWVIVGVLYWKKS